LSGVKDLNFLSDFEEKKQSAFLHRKKMKQDSPFRNDNSAKYSEISEYDNRSSIKKKPIGDIKADVYAILKTGQILKKGFDMGNVDENFYFRRMQGFYMELSNIQSQLIPWNKKIIDLFSDLNMGPEMNTVLTLISGIQDYQFDHIAQHWSIDPLQLGQNVSEITSNFITLLDYLHITDEMDYYLLFDLLKDLIGALSEYELFIDIYQSLKTIAHNLTKTSENLFSDQSFIQKVENSINTQFERFKRNLK